MTAATSGSATSCPSHHSERHQHTSPAGMGSALKPKAKRSPCLLKLLLSRLWLFFHSNEKVTIIELYLFYFLLDTCNKNSQKTAAKFIFPNTCLLNFHYVSTLPGSGDVTMSYMPLSPFPIIRIWGSHFLLYHFYETLD